jgi:hypothetical protein
MIEKLFFMFLKCHYHLHPLVELKKGVIYQRIEEDNSFDIFEMTNSTSEQTTLINRELLIF